MAKASVIIIVVAIFIFVNANDDRTLGKQKRKEAIERFRLYIERLDPYNLPDDLKARMHDLSNVPLNVAVTGESGVGKSTFINSVRGLLPTDPGAAAIGVIETTQKITNYTDAKNRSLIYSDLPGTSKFPRRTYLTTVGFDQFDFYIIISATRFTENDAWLAREVKQRGKQFYFIRNKINIDLKNEERDRPTRTSKEILTEIRNDCIDNLFKYTKDQNANVYLMSALLSDVHLWDFPELIEDSIQANWRLKQQTLLDRLTSYCKTTIKKRSNQIRTDFWKICVLSAISALIPIPILVLLVDAILIKCVIHKLRRDFLLDEERLLSLMASQPWNVKTTEFSFLTRNYLTYYLPVAVVLIIIEVSKRSTDFNKWPLEKKILKFNSIIGRIALMIICLYMTSYRLDALADQLETNAYALIDYFLP